MGLEVWACPVHSQVQPSMSLPPNLVSSSLQMLSDRFLGAREGG
jgi:hypothetical protein